MSEVDKIAGRKAFQQYWNAQPAASRGATWQGAWKIWTAAINYERSLK